MEGMLELDVIVYSDEIRLATPDDIREWELETASQLSIPTARLFVALYPYNPASMSPNKETAGEELPFVPGQIIKSSMPFPVCSRCRPRCDVQKAMWFLKFPVITRKAFDAEQVFGDKDCDGFYHGESGGLSGYVPSNMVAEVPVDDDYLKHLLMQQGFLPVDQTGVTLLPDTSDDIPDDVVVRRMVAIFEYDPWESSPNMDSENELGFRAGDIIYVFGDMDQDGFYYGDLHGRRGLVPSNYLQPLPWN